MLAFKNGFVFFSCPINNKYDEEERRGEERRGEERRGEERRGEERRGEERRGEEEGRDIPMVVLAPWPEMTIVWSGRGYSLSLIDFISKFLSPPHRSVLPTEPTNRTLLLYPSSPTSLADTFLLSLSFLSLSLVLSIEYL